MRGIILALALFAEIAAGPARADWAEEVSRPRTPVTLGASASCCSTARSSSGLATACRFGAATRCWKGCFLPEAEVWRVEPDLARAEPVRVTEATAFLHLPLTLVIGSQASPDRLRFLVSILCVRGVALRHCLPPIR